MGRPVSLSPLETARVSRLRASYWGLLIVSKAFRAPVFTEYNSNSTGRDLANAVGDRRVRYGATVFNTTSDVAELAFEDPQLVEAPVKQFPI